ncbi:MAG: hypothetical protein K2X43_13135, partial [Hyphomonadaceae bacterium]|nr:hypothetical protein [Hyphomonadaceae bacterium]
RRRRGRGRGEDRGDQRGRSEPARLGANGEIDEAQPHYAQDDQEPGPEEAYAEEGQGIPGTGEQPAGPLSEEERRGRRRRRGRRGGKRGRDRDAPRHLDEATAPYSNGSDPGPSDDDMAGLDAPRDPGSEPAYAADKARDEPARAAPEGHAAGSDEPRWSPPAEPDPAVVTQAPDSTRSAAAADAAPASAAAAREQPRREPVHVEPPIEEDDPSRPVRKGWWQRRFTRA